MATGWVTVGTGGSLGGGYLGVSLEISPTPWQLNTRQDWNRLAKETGFQIRSDFKQIAKD